MAETTSEYEPVSNGRDLQELLHALSEPGGASLMLDKPGGEPLPVLLMEIRTDEALVLDISAIREVAVDLKHGLGFRLLGQARSKLVRTPVLKISKAYEVEGRLLCEAPYPEQLEVLQRRDNFRAELNMSMEATVLVGQMQGGQPLQGALKNLSLEGALVALPLGTGAALAAAPSATQLKLIFPNGSQLEVSGALRHDHSDHDRQVMLAGFEFIGCGPEQERQLWFFVREIEREAARRSSENTSDGHATKEPSPLFQATAQKLARTGSRQGEFVTPMARRLSRLTAYLDNQLFALKQGRRLDAIQLSRHADRLLALLEEDREAVLFALVCMQREPVLVQHGLAVAVRLADIAGQHAMPRDLRKALLACAMVHDLGKALLPDGIRQATSLDQAQYRELQVHVDSVIRSLGDCNWLSSAVIQAVVGGANERLDGSGYPHGLQGEQLHELTRLMAVVDVVDAMGRERADRPAWTIDAIYKHLLEHPQLFDQRWVQRYIRHFGVVPIGTLVRYAGGELAWVQRVDKRGVPIRVLRTEQAVAPEPETLGAMLEGKALAQLGKPIEKLAMPASDS